TASVRLQQVIDEISEDRDWHNEAEMYQQELDDRLSEIKREILKEPTLSEAIDPFFEYSRLLKNVISGAAALNHINPSQQRFVSKLIDYFYGGAWNYVALAISKNTVDYSLGDNKRRLRDAIDSDLRELRGEFETELLRLQERSDQYDLLPDSYKQDVDRSQSDTDSSQQDMDYVEAWTKISDEVIMDDLS